MVDKGAVVALARDGKALGIGGFGPTQIVFPRAERADLADMPDDWWIWQIYHIRWSRPLAQSAGQVSGARTPGRMAAPARRSPSLRRRAAADPHGPFQLSRRGALHAEAVPLPEIAAAVGTPVYVYSARDADPALPGVRGGAGRAATT